MAKKTVATLQDKTKRNMVKVIKTIKSPKTGAYTFREEMVSKDNVNDFLKD
ncbi:MAG: DUF4295 domain-containing protein [Bacteroidetes bacterium]|nr:DUF4295 domain-containing protein [Bacteroidota bacterium]